MAAAKKKIVKRRGYQLAIDVRKTNPPVVRGPSPPEWKSPHALRISFATHIRRRFLDDSSTVVRVDEEPTGIRHLCFDNRFFFKRDQRLNNCKPISQLLESFQVKANLRDRFVSLIMSFGESKYNKDGKEVKRKIPKGLRVDLTWILTFNVDRNTGRQLLRQSLDEYSKFVWNSSNKGLQSLYSEIGSVKDS